MTRNSSGFLNVKLYSKLYINNFFFETRNMSKRNKFRSKQLEIAFNQTKRDSNAHWNTEVQKHWWVSYWNSIYLSFHSKENRKKCHCFNPELSQSAVNTATFPVTQKIVSEKHFNPSWSGTAITQIYPWEKKIFNFIIILPIQWWKNPKG